DQGDQAHLRRPQGSRPARHSRRNPADRSSAQAPSAIVADGRLRLSVRREAPLLQALVASAKPQAATICRIPPRGAGAKPSRIGRSPIAVKVALRANAFVV